MRIPGGVLFAMTLTLTLSVPVVSASSFGTMSWVDEQVNAFWRTFDSHKTPTIAYETTTTLLNATKPKMLARPSCFRDADCGAVRYSFSCIEGRIYKNTNEMVCQNHSCMIREKAALQSICRGDTMCVDEQGTCQPNRTGSSSSLASNPGCKRGSISLGVSPATLEFTNAMRGASYTRYLTASTTDSHISCRVAASGNIAEWVTPSDDDIDFSGQRRLQIEVTVPHDASNGVYIGYVQVTASPSKSVCGTMGMGVSPAVYIPTKVYVTG
jgi:hypothetical protein